MTDWNAKIDEALAAKAKREAEQADVKRAQADLKARQQQEFQVFTQDTLMPALEQVRVLLTAPERDREVEIRKSGPDTTTIYVTDKNAPLPRPSELLVSFKLGTHPTEPNHVRLTAERGAGNGWHPMPEASGRLENVAIERIVNSLLEAWVNSVKQGT